MQLFPPDKNNNGINASKGIGTIVPMPDTVSQLLRTACYDCHSNNTNYPWYTNIQPVGWWLSSHVEEGKKYLNLDEFAAIAPKNGKTAKQRQQDKLQEMAESLREGWMPLDSYLWTHKAAKLTDGQKKLLINWTDSARKAIALLPEKIKQ